MCWCVQLTTELEGGGGTLLCGGVNCARAQRRGQLSDSATSRCGVHCVVAAVLQVNVECHVQ